LSVPLQGKKVWDIPDELWLNMQRNDDIQLQDVFHVLESIDFSRQERNNVSATRVQGFCLGITDARCDGVIVSTETLKQPQLTQFLASFCKQGNPDFKFTCIQVRCFSQY
jgi:hypothetical protein